MTRILTGHLLHVPRDPFAAARQAPAGRNDRWAQCDPEALQAIHGGAIAIRDGTILDVGEEAAVRARHPQAEVEASGGWILPGLVDGHVHFPQLPVTGAMGLTLLDWLRERTFPHEARFANATFARSQARAFLQALARNGTTTALVFGAHFAGAMAAFFEEADASKLRITAGLNVSDRELPEAMRSDPDRAVAEALDLIDRFHGRGRLRYAVTPRFAVSCSDALLAACGEVLRSRNDLWFTTHVNEMPDEVAYVRNAFPHARDYLDVYDRHGLVGPRSVFAHDVHPSDAELTRLAAAGAPVCHCAGSNAWVGSGLFPLRRHLDAGVPLLLGSDVGGGPTFLMLAEARAAYRTQMLAGPEGVPIDPARALWLATAAGAQALGLGALTGDLTPGKAADLMVVRPAPHGTLAERLRHASDAQDAAAALIALAAEGDVARTMVEGRDVHVAPAA